MGVSSERGLKCGFPCTAANYLVSLTTLEQILCFRQWLQKKIFFNLAQVVNSQGWRKMRKLADFIQQITAIFMSGSKQKVFRTLKFKLWMPRRTCNLWYLSHRM